MDIGHALIEILPHLPSVMQGFIILFVFITFFVVSIIGMILKHQKSIMVDVIKPMNDNIVDKLEDINLEARNITSVGSDVAVGLHAASQAITKLDERIITHLIDKKVDSNTTIHHKTFKPPLRHEEEYKKA